MRDGGTDKADPCWALIAARGRSSEGNAVARQAARYGVPAFSGDHDDLDADRVIGALCPRVPGRKRDLMLLGGKCYECVIDGATCETQAAERVRQFRARGPLSSSGAGNEVAA
jgi:hypothetical protein